ncbi:MAG: carboxy terminal-processing peptidase [Rhodoferax sp.]|nr:carboxy terminal-processing peptidase [Rhodoferax sp.]
MKQKILGLVLCLLASVQVVAFAPPALPSVELKPEKYEERAAHVAAEILSRHHYKPVQIDKAMSGQIFDRYLKSLDGDKLFFIQSDIDRLSVNRDSVGEMIFREDLTVPFAIFNLYKRRAVERLSYARNLLQGPFDFTAQESLKLERAKQAWPQSEAEVQELWRKRVKNDWLGLKLAGKNDKDIRQVLDKRYDSTIKRINKINNTDAFETFMNAYTTTIEPHTNYMGIRAAEEFNISMRLSLIGIGAVLTQTDDYTTIRELVAGGPAGLSGKLKVGDRIVGVGQGNEPMVDIVGWRQDDAVQLIRGAVDTVVRLEILPAEAGLDGPHKIVTLVRKPINLKEQAAKSTIQSIKDGATTRRIGVISLPSFYEDFTGRSAGTKDFKSASRDVERLLIELKKAKVDSVLVDLRGNGGGSLAQAIELTGLFIGNGPVLQQRNAQGKVWVDSSKRPTPVWDGPMGVLINRGSASASEIFAAAIQDYGRGLVLGEPSFGKGTVQTIVDLDQVVRNGKPQFGGLKMTVAQFFRINGGTTQLRGVNPDIRFPGFFDDGEFGESSVDNALPWSRIGQAEYSPLEGVHAILPQLSAKHSVRGNTDQAFKFLKEDIAEYRLQRMKTEISLNEAVRRNERDARTALLAARKTLDGKPGSATAEIANTDDALEPEDSDLPRAATEEKTAKKSKDILLLEAAHILSDAVGMAGSPRVAANDAVLNQRKVK